MIRMARTALLAPILVAGGFLTLTLGSVNVFAASAGTTTHVASVAEIPQTASRPHKHERVDCSPGHISKNGQCAATFIDPKTKGEPNPVGQRVCFSVITKGAGSIST